MVVAYVSTKEKKMFTQWIKKQLTEVTAWGGFIICASVFFTPDWITFSIGVVLIMIDDDVAKKFVAWAAPILSKKVDGIADNLDGQQ
jgi:hypothetical protein